MSAAEFMDDPNFAAFLPETPNAAKKRHLPTHEDCSPLDIERAAMHLKRGGTLGTMEGYEERPGQIEMLKAIVHAFNSREHLLVEAGTGVGKSLAYLIPAILWSATNDTSTVVSTATRNLQSQLLQNDIPNALKILGDKKKDFKVALLKGRTNYLCLKAVEEFFEAGFWTLSKEDQDEMPHFIDWLKTTQDGDLDFYEGLSRSILTCPGEECPGRHCRFFSRCFVYRARARAAEADLVLANHSLVLAEAASSGELALLPPYSRLIIDEAHNLENSATSQLSKEFSHAAFMRIVNRLDRKGRGRSKRRNGVLAQVAYIIKRGQLEGATAREISRLLAEFSSVSIRAVDSADALFDIVAHLLSPAGAKGVCRFRCIEDKTGTIIRQHSINGLFQNYDKRDWDENALQAAFTSFESSLGAIVNILHAIKEILVSPQVENEGLSYADLAIQLDASAQAIVEFANDAAFILAAKLDDYAYWIEEYRTDRGNVLKRLIAAPLYVGKVLNELLYKPKDSVILSSATLRVGKDFRYMMKRLGCLERFQAITAASPFNYLTQTLTLALDCLSDPASAPQSYAQSLANVLKELFAATNGRALVLFTSYEMMNNVASLTRDMLYDSGLNLLVQGEGMSRETITNKLRKAKEKTVVFGAQSFWEGVDVAGEALSCVVIARLPFAMRTDPIIEARSEKIEREGGSSFRDYYLPEAVIKFRQGFGRLIRTKQDRGTVIVTDPRIITKSYGAIFRHSIPSSIHSVSDVPELVSRVEEFFAQS